VWIDERYRMILSLVHDFHGYVPMPPVKVSLMKGILGKNNLSIAGHAFIFIFNAIQWYMYTVFVFEAP